MFLAGGTPASDSSLIPCMLMHAVDPVSSRKSLLANAAPVV
jgi:hypothetical protein